MIKEVIAAVIILGAATTQVRANAIDKLFMEDTICESVKTAGYYSYKMRKDVSSQEEFDDFKAKALKAINTTKDIQEKADKEGIVLAFGEHVMQACLSHGFDAAKLGYDL